MGENQTEANTTDLFDPERLKQFKKSELVDIILEMQKEKKDLKSQLNKITDISDRVVELERSHTLYLQYGRRNCIEISGIPAEVEQNKLEDEVMKIYHEADVKVHGKTLGHFDMEACHRIGKKGVVIVRFVNRKFARQGLFNSAKLKKTKIYGNQHVYINDSLCPQFNYIGYVVRKLKKTGRIEGYKVRNGIFSVKLQAGDNKYVEITHKIDFDNLNLDVATALTE